IDDGQVDNAKRRLHWRQFVKIVQDNQTLFTALQFDDDAHAMPIALVANIAYTFKTLFINKFGDFFDETGLVDLVRNFRYDNDVPIFPLPLDRCARTHRNLATAVLVGLINTAAAVNDSGSGKVGAGYEWHQILQ